MKNYLIWITAVILWNFIFPNVHPILDVLMALILKHMFDIINYTLR